MGWEPVAGKLGTLPGLFDGRRAPMPTDSNAVGEGSAKGVASDSGEEGVRAFTATAIGSGKPQLGSSVWLNSSPKLWGFATFSSASGRIHAGEFNMLLRRPVNPASMSMSIP